MMAQISQFAEMPRHSFDDLVGVGEEVAGMARPSVQADP
jgi:hypothetical protein